MTTTSHLNALERRHATLDDEILHESQRPAQDELKIGLLKRKKLELKDEISRLQNRTRQ
ncbi:YdcH family protein [Maritalea sp.]|uniref:YdcH family protein n=1 Tax=Maritalea sp. TaxID=2003361 RepID=UPI003EF6A476